MLSIPLLVFTIDAFFAIGYFVMVSSVTEHKLSTCVFVYCLRAVLPVRQHSIFLIYKKIITLKTMYHLEIQPTSIGEQACLLAINQSVTRKAHGCCRAAHSIK